MTTSSVRPGHCRAIPGCCGARLPPHGRNRGSTRSSVTADPGSAPSRARHSLQVRGRRLGRRGPATATTSPRMKSPSTPQMPAGSRLRPASVSACLAPPSTRRVPRSVAAELSQRARLVRVTSRGANRVPMRSPAAMRGRTSGSLPLGDDDLDAVETGAARRLDLRPDATRPAGAGRSRRAGQQLIRHHMSVSNQLRVRVATRIAGIETVGRREQDQQVGVDELRDQGRQGVVVAKPQLLRRHHVVLVRDRQHALVQQAGEGVARVEKPVARGQVGAGHQGQRHGDVVRREHGAVAGDERRLSHGGQGPGVW